MFIDYNSYAVCLSITGAGKLYTGYSKANKATENYITNVMVRYMLKIL